jgi:hypothetical protein
MAKSSVFTFTPNATTVFSANPGLTFNSKQLQLIQTGQLISVGTIGGRKEGCIDWLRYEGDTRLTFMSLDGVIYGATGTNRTINLNDFREKLASAHANGQRISFCYNSATDKMDMLNVHRCGCSCSK